MSAIRFQSKKCPQSVKTGLLDEKEIIIYSDPHDHGPDLENTLHPSEQHTIQMSKNIVSSGRHTNILMPASFSAPIIIEEEGHPLHEPQHQKSHPGAIMFSRHQQHYKRHSSTICGGSHTNQDGNILYSSSQQVRMHTAKQMHQHQHHKHGQHVQFFLPPSPVR